MKKYVVKKIEGEYATLCDECGDELFIAMALLPLGMFFGVRWSAEYVREGRLGKMKTADKIAVLIVLVLTVVFCVLRNTEAFSFLAPAL